MMRVKLALAAVLALLATIVVFQNRGPVETKILFMTVEMPHSILLISTAAVGFVLGMLVTLAVSVQSRPKPTP